MKRFLSTSLSVMLTAFIITAAAETLGDKAMYVYRNNSKLDVFFYANIDSMRVSRLDCDSIECEEFVTQEIWTVDSVCRIPLAEIDSIAFHPLPTIYKPGVRNIDADMRRFIVRVDGDDIYFKTNTPAKQLPVIGDKLLTRELDDVFTEGFRGEVISIDSQSDAVVVHTEELSMVDVYEQFFTSEGFDLVSPEEQRMRARQRIPDYFDHTYVFDPIKVKFKDGKWSLPFGIKGDIYEEPTRIWEKECPDLKDQIEASWDINIGFDRLVLTICPSIRLMYNVSILPPMETTIQTAVNFGISIDYDGDFFVEGTGSLGPCINISDPIQKKLNEIFPGAKDKVKVEVKAGADFPFGGKIVFGGRFHEELQLYIQANKTLSTRADYFEAFSSVEGLLPDDFKIIPNRFENKSWQKLDYTFGEFNLGAGYFSALGLEFGRIPKDCLPFKEENGNARIGLGVDYHEGVMMNTVLPLYLSDEPLKDRSTRNYEQLTKREAVRIDWEKGAIVKFQPLIVTIGKFDLFQGINWDPKETVTILSRGFAPIFDSPKTYYDRETMDYFVNYGISGNLLFPHPVGIVLFDNEIKEDSPEYASYEPTVIWNDEPYKFGDDDFYNYTIALPELKINHEYEIYPCMEQRTTLNFDKPKVLLAPQPTKLKIEVKPITGSYSNFSNKGTSVTIYCTIDNVNLLKNKQFVVGTAISTSSDVISDPTFIPSYNSVNGVYASAAYNLKNSTTYHYCAYLKCDDEIFYGEVKSLETPESEEVDLGLSVNWCSHNVGAKESYEYGYYYSWGEINRKGSYTWDTYFDSPYDSEGAWAGCSFNESIQGGDKDPSPVGWRMPTREEMDELVNKCTWEWTTNQGVAGYKITGPSGAFIFMPAAGLADGSQTKNTGTYGGYWSGTISPSSASMAANLLFMQPSTHMLQWSNRYVGRNIRPVTPRSN